MQVSVETTSGLERRLIVGVPAEKVDNAVNARLQEAAKTARIDGFRPGKVPVKVMRQRYGQSVRLEVLGQVMNDSLYEAIQEQDLKPAGRPDVEPRSIEEGKDLEFVATFEIFPDIELKDYSAIEVVRPVAEVTEADIDKTIERLREQRADFEKVERAAKEGDQVNIDYEGTRDGEAFEGGSADGSDLVLGSGQMIPGFEDAIEGMSAGDEKTVPLTFPEDYHSEELRGAAVEFRIRVNEVREKTLPELNEEFFSQFGIEAADEAAFREEVAKNMRRELDNAVENRVKEQVMDGVLKLHEEVQVPKALVQQEIDALRNQSLQQFGAMAEQLDTKELLPDDLFRENAERRVKLGLILNELVNQEDIKADPEAVRAKVEELAENYEDKEQVINHYYSNPQQLQAIESLIVENKVVENLLEKAKVSEETSTYEQVMSPPEPETESEEA